MSFFQTTATTTKNACGRVFSRKWYLGTPILTNYYQILLNIDEYCQLLLPKHTFLLKRHVGFQQKNTCGRLFSREWDFGTPVLTQYQQTLYFFEYCYFLTKNQSFSKRTRLKKTKTPAAAFSAVDMGWGTNP